MRPVLPRTRRRANDAGTSTATRVKRSGRSNAAPASGGPVAPESSYVSRRGRRIGGGSRGAGSIFPRRRSIPALRRAILATLICAAVGLITISYRGGPVLHGAQLAVLDVVAPIERGFSRAWDPIAGGWSWTGRLFSAASENPKLEQENAELREQVRISATQAEKLHRLQRALNYEQTAKFPRGFDRVHASVSVRKPGAVERSLVIDRGSDAGIGVDDAVMVTGGLIGRVTAVTSSTSVVGLILDDTQQVSASITGREAWGVLRTISTEGTPTLQLRFVDQADKVERNDQVVTSGFASGELRAVYPGGIPIGYVSSVGDDPADVHKTVQITPYVEFGRIDEVLVLVEANGGTSS